MVLRVFAANLAIIIEIKTFYFDKKCKDSNKLTINTLRF